MRWTNEQYEEWQATQNARESTFKAEDIPDIGKEEVLQGKILKWAKERGFPCQCFRKSRKAIAFLVPGLPD